MTERSSRSFLGALVVLGASLVGLTGGGLVLQANDQRSSFIALALVQGAIYLAAVWLVLRVPPSRRVLILILCVAALMRVLPLATEPYLSSDMYRYIWDGRVQAAGINPYRYVPADAALADLRDDSIYPNINRKEYAPTIYPPVAQAIFLAVTRIGESLTVMKLAMVAFEAASIALLLLVLRRSGMAATNVLIYAWHPLTVWEFAGSSHIDAATVAFVALALLLRQSGRDGWTGVALAAASLVKPFPLAITPALYRPWSWRFPVAFAATACLAYLPYLSVGERVLGFLPGYIKEEGLAAGTGFYPLWLLREVLPFAVPTPAYIVGALLILAGLAFWVMLRRDPKDHVASATILALAFVFLVSPHYPNYLAWLLVLGVLLPYGPLLYMTAASFLLYLPIDLGFTGSIVYGGMIVLAVLQRFRPSVRLPSSEVPHVVDYSR